jgi:hypothetical protein
MILVPALNHAHPAMGRMVSQETSPLRGIIAPANGAASLFNAVDNDKATLGGTPSSALVPILGQTLGISNGTAGFGAAPKGSNAPKGTYFFVGTFDGGSGSTRNIASSNTTGTGGWRFEIQGDNGLRWTKNGISAITSFSVAFAAGTPLFIGVSWDVARIQNFVMRDLTTGRVTYFTANDTAAFGSDSSATSRVLGTWAGNFSGKCKLAGLLPVYMPMAALLQLSEQPFEVLDDWFRTRAIGKTPTGGGTGYTLTADSGSYSLTGVAAALRATRALAGAAGSYALTGQDATLTYTPAGGEFTLTADAGSYALTGVAAGLKSGRKVAGAAGSYSLSGQAAGLRRGRNLVAAAGSYTLTGVAATFRQTYALDADAGSYVITGMSASLEYSNQGIWTPVSAAGGTWTPATPAGGTWTPS